MILWTIQHKEAYEEMLRTGVLRANPTHIFEEFFRDSYDWMAEQMKKRIGNPPDGVELPGMVALWLLLGRYFCGKNRPFVID